MKVPLTLDSPIEACEQLIISLAKKEREHEVTQDIKGRVDGLETLVQSSLSNIASIQEDMSALPKMLRAIEAAKAEGRV